jgi:hypothetical protein
MKQASVHCLFETVLYDLCLVLVRTLESCWTGEKQGNPLISLAAKVPGVRTVAVFLLAGSSGLAKILQAQRNPGARVSGVSRFLIAGLPSRVLSRAPFPAQASRSAGILHIHVEL